MFNTLAFSFLFLLLFGYNIEVKAQDTFSIVGLDTITGEVGSAGASCLDLITVVNPPFQPPPADFLAVVIPSVGAMNTQAAFQFVNQTNGRSRMLAGDTPAQILAYVLTNDLSPNPIGPGFPSPVDADSTIRQYGIVGFVNGSPSVAAYTGSNCFNYKSHLIGRNYSIQGNILLGQSILDSMEARFKNTQGSLTCKLMAAMQGANVSGADARCDVYGTSSLFAFLKVAKPTDTELNPSVNLRVKTLPGTIIDPIDSLQKLLNITSIVCPTSPTLALNVKKHNLDNVSIYPNPASTSIFVSSPSSYFVTKISVKNIVGQTLIYQEKDSNQLDISTLKEGVYFVELEIRGITEPKIVKFIKCL
jgi:uncharacterized Ntn-hydrolase superfamily protein